VKQPFLTALCPSNLSRTWADLGKYIYSSSQNELWIHQYISSQFENDFAKIELHSEFPWNGKVEIKVTSSTQFTLLLRLPSWSVNPQVKVNWQDVVRNDIPHTKSKAGYYPAPQESSFLSIPRVWSPNDLIEINFDMPIQLRRAHPKVKGHQGKVAITRGPLVYCLESTDNPNVDIFTVKVDTKSLDAVFDASLLGGITKINAKSQDGQPLTFIPYHLWGNRGESKMTVWVNA
jgi:DUF1680 family protein